MRWLVGLVALVVGAVCVPVAAAQPSFHGYAAPVALPGGDSGQLRRLYAAGPGNTETVRIVVTDKRGDVRALGPAGYAAEFSCTGSRCGVYVYNNTSLLPEVYRFDPASTKSAGVLSVAAAADLDLVMRADMTYGFRPAPGLFARMVGAFFCLMQWWPSFIALLVIGGCVVPAWVRLEQLFLGEGQRPLHAIALGVLQTVVIVVPFAGLYAVYLWATAYPTLLSLAAVSIPTLGFLLLKLSSHDGAEGAATVAA